MEQLLRDGYTTAGALDTWCIDCESEMPLLRSAMMLGDLKLIIPVLLPYWYDLQLCNLCELRVELQYIINNIIY
jgi:hypothetical protein